MNAQIEPILRTIDPELYVSEEVFALEKKHLLPFQFFLQRQNEYFHHAEKLGQRHQRWYVAGNTARSPN